MWFFGRVRVVSKAKKKSKSLISKSKMYTEENLSSLSSGPPSLPFVVCVPCTRRPLGVHLGHPGRCALAGGAGTLVSYLCCLGTVVLNGDLAEPRVIQGFFRGDALGGVVDKDALQQVEELPQEGARCRDNVLVRLVGAQMRSELDRGYLYLLTFNFFMALTNRLEARVVSSHG